MPALFLWSVLSACSGNDPATPAPEPTPPEPVVEAPEPVPVAQAPGPLRVVPASIRWDAEAKTLSVEAGLAGGDLGSRQEVIHVGVTVVTETHEEIDLIVHTLFPGAFDQPLWFSTELPQEPMHVLIGAWSTKVEPCEVERPGCKEFGFVLDDSIAAFPAGLYTEGMRQRFLPEEYTIAVQGDRRTIEAAAEGFAAIFASSVSFTEAPQQLQLGPGIWVQDDDDLGFAHAVASAVGGGLPYQVADTLPAPMVVILPQ